MTAGILALVGILVIANPIVQGVLGVINIGTTADQSIAWKTEGCPVHHWDGSIGYLCPKLKVVKK